MMLNFERWNTVKDGQAPCLVLLFGFSMNLQEWVAFGYIRRLRESFNVIAIDLRGHGQSPSPLEPDEYQLDKMAADVHKVLDCLELERAIIWGYSLGAKIALSSIGNCPQRFSGAVLGGFELQSVVDLENDIVSQTLRKGAAAWGNLFGQLFTSPVESQLRFCQVNAPALLALRQAEKDWPSLADVPSKAVMPVLLYAGRNCFYRDQVKEMRALFPDALYVEREGMDHFQLMTDADWICKLVVEKFG